MPFRTATLVDRPGAQEQTAALDNRRGVRGSLRSMISSALAAAFTLNRRFDGGSNAASSVAPLTPVSYSPTAVRTIGGTADTVQAVSANYPQVQRVFFFFRPFHRVAGIYDRRSGRIFGE